MIKGCNTMLYIKIKHIIDFILSFLALLILWPFLLLIAILIKLDSKGPVLFKQKRVGKGKTHFNMLKFRTMRIDTPKDIPTHMLENPEVYITRVGRLLRKTSMDELPQIWNIFVGHMSAGDCIEILPEIPIYKGFSVFVRCW